MHDISANLRLEIPVRDIVVVQHLHPVDDLVEELAGLWLRHVFLGHNKVEHLTPIKAATHQRIQMNIETKTKSCMFVTSNPSAHSIMR